MKDLVQTAIILVVVLLVAFIVFTTKGEDKLDFKLDLKINSEETFSYDLVASDYNGEYKKDAGDNRYILFGKNPEGTYRAYFIFLTASVKNIELRIDGGVMNEENEIKFSNASGTPLKMKVSNGNIVVSADGMTSIGDNKLEGNYIMQKPINKFSLDEFEIFTYNR